MGGGHFGYDLGRQGNGRKLNARILSFLLSRGWIQKLIIGEALSRGRLQVLIIGEAHSRGGYRLGAFPCSSLSLFSNLVYLSFLAFAR